MLAGRPDAASSAASCSTFPASPSRRARSGSESFSLESDRPRSATTTCSNRPRQRRRTAVGGAGGEQLSRRGRSRAPAARRRGRASAPSGRGRRGRPAGFASSGRRLACSIHSSAGSSASTGSTCRGSIRCSTPRQSRLVPERGQVGLEVDVAGARRRPQHRRPRPDLHLLRHPVRLEACAGELGRDPRLGTCRASRAAPTAARRAAPPSPTGRGRRPRSCRGRGRRARSPRRPGRRPRPRDGAPRTSTNASSCVCMPVSRPLPCSSWPCGRRPSDPSRSSTPARGRGARSARARRTPPRASPPAARTAAPAPTRAARRAPPRSRTAARSRPARGPARFRYRRPGSMQ